MTSNVETTPLLEGEADIIRNAAYLLDNAGIEYTLSVANESVPGS